MVSLYPYRVLHSSLILPQTELKRFLLSFGFHLQRLSNVFSIPATLFLRDLVSPLGRYSDQVLTVSITPVFSHPLLENLTEHLFGFQSLFPP